MAEAMPIHCGEISYDLRGDKGAGKAMNVWLLHEKLESSAKTAAVNRNEITQDLNLEIIYKSMARNDKYIYKVVKNVLTEPLTDSDTVLYRQEILKDCIKHYDSINGIYELSANTIETIDKFTEGSKRINSSNFSNAASVLNSLELLGLLVDDFQKLKVYLDTVEANFASKGLRAFYHRLCEDYSYKFVMEIKSSIKNMNFLTEGGEITFSGSVGQGLKLKDIIVNYIQKYEGKKKKGSSFINDFMDTFFRRNVIMLTDSKLAQDVRDMESAGLLHVMKLYQGFIRELTSFFENLHYQTAFYVGAANLQIRLKQMHIPTSMPKLPIKDIDEFQFQGLYLTSF
jgi:hypothetical protein